MVAKKKPTPLPYISKKIRVKPPINVPRGKIINLDVNPRLDARRANGAKEMAQKIKKFAKENPDAYSRRTAR